MFDDITKKIESLGIVPVIVINDASKAVPLAKAILDGGINAIEVTFRTAAAEESIRLIHQSFPEMIIGAGTVLTVDQASRAVNAGSQFIVSPGIDEETVKWCQDKKVLAIPGVCTASEVQKGIKLGLNILKFFPAEASGGVNMIKNLSGPFPQIKFMTTGGISLANIAEYAACSSVMAVGGSWMAKSDLIESDNWETITRLCRESITAIQGLSLIHFGINTDSVEEARKSASKFEIFGLCSKEGSSSTFMNTSIELMHTQFKGKHGHIGFKCFNVERTLDYLGKFGYTPDQDSIKLNEKGKIKVVYLNEEIEGFALHLVRA